MELWRYRNAIICYELVSVSHQIFIKDGSSVSLDATDEDECNWMCLVGVARCSSDQNCMAVQIGVDIFYLATREIPRGEELLVWYAPHYAKKVGRSSEPDGATVGEDIVVGVARLSVKL